MTRRRLHAERTARKVSLLGSGAVLFDVAGQDFDEALQRRILAVALALTNVPAVREAVPGMNNLMVVYDPVQRCPEDVVDEIDALWNTQIDLAPSGRMVDAPTVYGGEAGSDLNELAERTGLSPREVARIHAATSYLVAAVGAMPGFVYLSGLDPRLASPRLATPRSCVPVGSVIIGGAQTGIMPLSAPSGWHVIGCTSLRLFDVERDAPALLAPGDQVRFRIVRVDP